MSLPSISNVSRATNTGEKSLPVEAFTIDDALPRTAQERAYEVLRNAILRGELPPGTKLNQSALARRLLISTTPVREALGRLAGDGLVKVDAHRGAIVRGVDDDELVEIYELRQLLEPLASRRAAANITPDELALAENLWQQMQNHEDAATWADNNRRFHGIVATASRSPRLEKILKELQASSALYVQWSLTADPSRFESANLDHRELLTALRDGDGDRAARIEESHLHATVALLRTRRPD